jgi:nitrous oxide reductase accessory protein NosL
MIRRSFLNALLALAALPLAAGAARAGLDNLDAKPPGPRDLCPVCGMVVAKYPNWIASVVWRDGHAHHFDGAKDLFKFLFDPARYAPGHRTQDIARIVVTEYYDLKRIDARQAWYVIGSDTLGPMGHELIPFASRADAEEFMRDHKGRRILGFEHIGRELPGALDRGRF